MSDKPTGSPRGYGWVVFAAVLLNSYAARQIGQVAGYDDPPGILCVCSLRRTWAWQCSAGWRSCSSGAPIAGLRKQQALVNNPEHRTRVGYRSALHMAVLSTFMATFSIVFIAAGIWPIWPVLALFGWAIAIWIYAAHLRRRL